jgi:hypothetical protein
LILNFDDRGEQVLWGHALRRAAAMGTIQYLSTTRPDLSQEHIEYLGDLAAMKQLGLQGLTVLPDLAPLADLQQLDKLGLHSCRGVTAEKLRALRTLPRLKLIDLCCSDAGDDVAREVAQFASLEELHVEFSKISHDGLLELSKSKTLRVVHISSEQAAAGIAKIAPGITFDVK